MIDLDQHATVIENFIQTSIDRFKGENNGKPKSIGIYCCPWAGWLTTNFNINKTLKQTYNNCPDFEFVEFDILELEGWQKEYESEKPLYKINGRIIFHDPDLGDEKLNEAIFRYLEPIAVKLKTNNDSSFLLQMLDSVCVKVF